MENLYFINETNWKISDYYSEGNPQYSEITFLSKSLEDCITHTKSLKPHFSDIVIECTIYKQEINKELDDTLKHLMAENNYTNVNQITKDDIQQLELELYDEVDSYLVEENDYKSIDGAILYTWSWEKYVGYSVCVHEIGYANKSPYYYKNEELNEVYLKKYCDNSDRTFRNSISVLLFADEIAGLSKEEIKDKIIDSLHRLPLKNSNNEILSMIDFNI